MLKITLNFELAQKYKRLDQFLVDETDLSRSVIKQLFEKGEIKSSIPLKLNKIPKLIDGDEVSIEIHEPEPTPSEALPEDIPLEFLYQDEFLAIINKPAGLVVHPAPGNYTGTLVNALLHHCPDIKGIGGVQRPGIVHRLDKGTSGIMVIAKEQKTHELLVNLFSEHNIEREYEALAFYKGAVDTGTIKSMLDRHPKNRLKMTTRVNSGKEAITRYRVCKRDLAGEKDLCHFRVSLETGRTHQIRVHFSEILNAPLLNDEIYGNPKQNLLRLSLNAQNIIGDYPYPFLHARKLGFIHPRTEKELLFESPAPSPFKELLEKD